MLRRNVTTFHAKSPPIPFAVAVLKSSKKGCKIKLAGAVKAGRGFGISFNEGGHVWFRMFFDTTFKKLHLCKNDDAEIIGSQDCSFDFTSLFKLKISIGTTLEIKIKDGPNYSVNNITEFLDPVDLVSVHGDLVVIKATFTKFTISSNEETIQSFSQQRPPPLIRNQYAVGPTSHESPPSYQQASSMPIYSGVIIEDKDGHHQHFA